MAETSQPVRGTHLARGGWVEGPADGDDDDGAGDELV